MVSEAVDASAFFKQCIAISLLETDEKHCHLLILSTLWLTHGEPWADNVENDRRHFREHDVYKGTNTMFDKSFGFSVCVLVLVESKRGSELQNHREIGENMRVLSHQMVLCFSGIIVILISGIRKKRRLMQLTSNEDRNIGGGFHVRLSNLDISNSAMDQNEADASGRGVYCEVNSVLFVAETTFIGNKAKQGAPVALSESFGTANATTFRKGVASFCGGAVYAVRSTVQFSESSFDQNKAVLGGHLFGQQHR